MCLIVAVIACHSYATAQFSVNGQLMQRAEFRNGYGSLIADTSQSAVAVGQRMRAEGEYRDSSFRLFLSVQDVRIWGAVDHTKFTDPFLSVYEAYAEVNVASGLVARLGRQELNFDNARFLGNLDWALQGRSHDVALLKYRDGNYFVDAGLAYNQGGLSLANRPYAVVGHYKASQFLRCSTSLTSNVQLSFVFWNNGMEQSWTDPNGVTRTRVRYAQTLGLPTVKYSSGDFSVSSHYYMQMGRNIDGREVNAYNIAASLSYLLKLSESSTMRATAGAEGLSGTNPSDNDNVNRSFTPYFGTNHAHNGYMDYFFVGNGFVNGPGLRDLFLRLRFDLTPSLFASANIHSFASAVDLPGSSSNKRSLGEELDLTLGWKVNDNISVQVGYSQLFPHENLKSIQTVSSPSSTQNWAYFMLLIRPSGRPQFVGLLF